MAADPDGVSFLTLGDGCSIAYRFDGTPGQPVLMLSNSLGTDLGLWAPQLEPLGARFRLLRYDSRGHGASSAPSGEYSLERLGRDALELLDGLSIGHVNFCGVSKGGMVGQWLGARAPSRVLRLVLANTAAYVGPPSGWQQRIERVLEHGMVAIAEGVVERWFTPRFRASSPGTVAAARETFLSMPPSGYAGCCAALRDMDLRPLSAQITAPTLLVSGAHDAATPPERAHELARALPGSPEHVSLDAAHLSNVEQADAFNRAVLEFLR